MLLAGVAVIVRDKHSVQLALEQREELRRLIRFGKHPARVTARARILLKSDDVDRLPKWLKLRMWP